MQRLQWRLLIVDGDGISVGLIVEQSLGTCLSGRQLRGGRPGLDAPGAYRHGGRVFYVVSLAALVRDERFLNVAE
jgi:hypothetical protein